MHSSTEYNEQHVERRIDVPIKYIYKSNLRQDDAAYLILTSNIFALKDCTDDGKLLIKYVILQQTPCVSLWAHIMSQQTRMVSLWGLADSLCESVGSYCEPGQTQSGKQQPQIMSLWEEQTQAGSQQTHSGKPHRLSNRLAV